MKAMEFFSITVFIGGLIVSMVGFHNIDRAINILILGDRDLTHETFTDGSVRSATDTYMIGIRQILLGFVCYISSVFILLIGRIEFNKTLKDIN